MVKNTDIVKLYIEMGELFFNIKSKTIIKFKRRSKYFNFNSDIVNSCKMVIPEMINGFEVEKIGKDVFFCLHEIEEIILPNTVEEIGEGAFNNSDIKKMTISKNINKIGEGAFSGCRYLENIYVDKENKYFSSYDGILYNKDMTELIYCAENKSKGKKLIIPNGVKKICIDAFSSTSIEEVILPDTVEEIEEGAFKYSDIKKMTISKNINKIEEAAFSGCRYLENIYVDKENKYFSSYDGILYNKDMTELIYCAEGKNKGKKLIIPNGVKKICRDAFSCTSIEEIVLPNTVEVIEDDDSVILFVKDKIILKK